ncbi:GPP34 family phosphoprotein [Streptomyces sp. NPDC053079]|uniref:GOLPH3/VPS74 family protein n=1 Tax=Streptomyces sp. NPDC053079 TaxID=3365697 RepID=UPI0037D63296
MTTARDLALTAMDVAPGRPVEPGDLSLALAGAELIDLLARGAVTLDGDRIVPGERTAMGDPVLDQAVGALDREAPYEAVGDWLWRRGRGLASVYVADLGAEDRSAANEPVLVALAQAVGIGEEGTEEAPITAGDAVETVLAAVYDAVMELEAVRQRRAVEQSAFDNVWRGD